MGKVTNESKTTNFKDAAFIVLHSVRIPLHSNDITRVARSSGILKTHGKTPASTMRAKLYEDINEHRGNSRFVLEGPSIFGINYYRTGIHNVI